MSIKATDTILGAPRGDAATAIAYARSHGAAQVDFVAEYITEVYRLAPLVGIDPVIVLAQSLQETTDAGTPWSSFWWRERLNPAGIGITGDPAQDAVSPAFANGTDAARAHLAHLLVYAVGPTVAALRWKRVVGGDIAEVDSRYRAYFDEYADTAQAITIADLAGKWATAPDYATGIVARGNAAFTVPDQGGTTPVPTPVTFGNVPHPDYIDSYVPDSQNTAWNDLGQRHIKGIVWHRMLGSLTGTDQFFHGGAAALTDYGVGVAAQDGANLDGVLYRWNDPLGRRAPWANGPLSNPYGDGLAFFNLYGIDAINRDLTSIEISGSQTTAVSAKARQTVCELTAYWADQYHVSWETFPLIPEEGNRSFVIWHQEITIGTEKLCPFTEVINLTPSMIEQTRGILKQYQVTATPGPTPTPVPVPTYADTLELPWFDQDLERGYPTDHVWDSEEFGRVHVFAALRPYQSIREANRLRGLNIKSGRVGPRTKVRESFRGPYTMTVDGRTFVLTYGRSFVDAGTLTPRVSVRPR